MASSSDTAGSLQEVKRAKKLAKKTNKQIPEAMKIVKKLESEGLMDNSEIELMNQKLRSEEQALAKLLSPQGKIPPGLRGKKKSKANVSKKFNSKKSRASKSKK